MTARELRIGNYVYDTKSEVNIINLEALTYICKEPLNQVKPIPLTEEWLGRFGFELIKFVAPNQQCGIDLFYGYDYAIKKIGNKTDLIIRYKHDKFKLDSFYSTDFKYVHTLQNLYFVLTSEELLTK